MVNKKYGYKAWGIPRIDSEKFNFKFPNDKQILSGEISAGSRRIAAKRLDKKLKADYEDFDYEI